MNDALKKGQKAAGIATIATILLAAVKGIVGIISGNILIIADAIHSAADVLAIFASWYGLKISQRKPDEKFPYGYYKAENISTLIVSVFIFFIAYRLFTESYSRIWVVEELKIPFIVLSVSLMSAIVSYRIAKYEEKIGTQINSQSLMANSYESKMDVVTSLIVFVGLILSYLKINYVAGVIGILFSFLIVKIGYQNAKISIFSLMDASPDTKLEKNIEKIILNVQGVMDISHIKLRQSGLFIFGVANIKVLKHLDVKRAHQIADIIEEKIKKKYPHIESFIIRVEPYKPEKQKIIIPLDENKGLDSRVTGHFGRAKYFLFVLIKDKKIESWHIKSNPFINEKARAGLDAAKFVLEEKIDVVVLQKIGEIAFHTLRDNFVDLYITHGKTPKTVIHNLINNKLKRLQKPTHASDK
ncbi:MAG: cation diffusion facilitator family transporter [Candidatus Aenigmarchaeota archaeon]|nr:cation diffusion facilitator family transporter [Candidatus Aenigmarchaeota archaeon]